MQEVTNSEFYTDNQSGSNHGASKSKLIEGGIKMKSKGAAILLSSPEEQSPLHLKSKIGKNNLVQQHNNKFETEEDSLMLPMSNSQNDQEFDKEVPVT